MTAGLWRGRRLGRRGTGAAGHLLRLLRALSLLLLAGVCTVLLVRCAPGYFSRTGELDGEHGETARRQLAAQQGTEGTALQASLRFTADVLRGRLGESQQYHEPVGELLLPRLRTTARILLPAAVLAPMLALLCAVPCSQLRAPALERTVALLTLLGVAVPVSVLAGCSVLSGLGGPSTVLLLVVAARDFRFFTRLLRRQGKAPCLLYTRAYGAGSLRTLHVALLLPLRGQLVNLLALSFITALGGIVPVEVIFGVSGVGAMAWTAAMNRDLPVLLAVTLLVAACISAATLLANSSGLSAGEAGV